MFDLPEVPRLRCVEHWIQKRRCPCGHLNQLVLPGGCHSAGVLRPADPGDPLLTRQLQQLVASLPTIPRTVLVLHYQEELTADEIGELLSMPTATVKSHLQRTLRLLREKAARVLK